MTKAYALDYVRRNHTYDGAFGVDSSNLLSSVCRVKQKK